MLTKNADKKREQMMMFSMDDMVPKDHMLRSIDKAINWNFIYDLVEEKYCADNGRPSMDPVPMVKHMPNLKPSLKTRISRSVISSS